MLKGLAKIVSNLVGKYKKCYNLFTIWEKAVKNVNLWLLNMISDRKAICGDGSQQRKHERARILSIYYKNSGDDK